ncbi:LysR family transcriptional regulator [Asticcacaulis sp. EMRT-3]|uniref:LysR family transcriptional regulator n=1 Tax=Asticcacaulis sp. EMRT-3 TaxID=3040349 RepID=UPI0024AED3BA|nr:LysR family transcriptional regulator [Asticcacaulis sp. EMRT-3]MDI7776563.1 LysR family transcriptional regulator [Asticcacaulis sp. EMRT-3]
MDRFGAMRAFVAVTEHSSFAKAALHTGVSRPGISRAIQDLESALGVRLLARTTRTVVLTFAGKRYFDDCRRILSDIAMADASAAGLPIGPSGNLKIAAPPAFGRKFILPVVAEYLSLHSKVTVDVNFGEGSTTVPDSCADLIFCLGHSQTQPSSAIQIGAAKRIVCAAPSYLATYGEPQSPSDLTGHHVIMTKDTATPYRWEFKDNQSPKSAVLPRLICSHAEDAVAAAIEGCGLVCAMSYHVEAAIRKANLRPVLTAFEAEAVPIHIGYQDVRGAWDKVRPFVDLTMAHLGANKIFRLATQLA